MFLDKLVDLLQDVRQFAWLDISNERLPSDQEYGSEYSIGHYKTDHTDIESNHGADTEQSSDEIAENTSTASVLNAPSSSKTFYIGRDKTTKWLKQKPNTPSISHDITYTSGPTDIAKNAKTALECISLFLDDETIDKITTYTNVYITTLHEKYSRERDCKLTEAIEIKAFVGLLYMVAIKKTEHLNLKGIWLDDGTGCDVFKATMSINRFLFLLRVLHFDDINTRQERKKTDNLAPIREVFESFAAHCNENYVLGNCCTIDEMLESYRGRCKFRVHMSSKSTKHGIKLYALVDSKSLYTSNLEVYAGKQPPGNYNVSQSSADVIKRIAKPILNTGRNLIMGSNFTSIPLFDELINEYETTAVGAFKKNKKEIPALFLTMKDRPASHCLFGFDQRKTLVSYALKKKSKNIVLVLSTIDSNDNIHANTEAQPDIVSFYESTKSAVDIVDQSKEKHSVARVTNRWPMRLFFSILNISGINAQIIYKANTQNLMERSLFLKEIGLELVKPDIMRRASMENISIDLKFKIKQFIPVPDLQTVAKPTGYCAICPRRKNRRSKKTCSACNQSLCTEHVTFMCSTCYEKYIRRDLIEQIN